MNKNTRNISKLVLNYNHIDLSQEPVRISAVLSRLRWFDEDYVALLIHVISVSDLRQMWSWNHICLGSYLSQEGKRNMTIFVSKSTSSLVTIIIIIVINFITSSTSALSSSSSSSPASSLPSSSSISSSSSSSSSS